MEKFLAHLIALVVSVPLSMFAAVVTISYWGWFVTPTFGIPAPALVPMIGINFFVALYASGSLTRNDIIEKLDKLSPEDGDNIRILKHQLTGTIVLLWAWGFGWVLNLFM